MVQNSLRKQEERLAWDFAYLGYVAETRGPMHRQGMVWFDAQDSTKGMGHWGKRECED